MDLNRIDIIKLIANPMLTKEKYQIRLSNINLSGIDLSNLCLKNNRNYDNYLSF